jgi:hypothetical protein
MVILLDYLGGGAQGWCIKNPAEPVNQTRKFLRPYCGVLGNHSPAGSVWCERTVPDDRFTRGLPFHEFPSIGGYPKGEVVEVFAHEE